MIEVRIRHEDETDAVHFTEVPYDKLDDVIPLIKRWGIYTASGDYDANDIVGQFVYQDRAMFFEVILCD